MKHGSCSLLQWCIDNNKQWILDCWDVEKNKGVTPSDVLHSKKESYYFHCGNINHTPVKLNINYLTSKRNKTTRDNFCIGCKSVGAYIINNYSDDVLSNIWSDMNKCSPYEVSSGSSKKIFIRCVNNINHPDYDIAAYNIKNSFNCPYCIGKRVCPENSFGSNYPDIISLWSDKNDKTPFEYSRQSNSVIYLKCSANKHDDYKRKICAHVMYGFRCPECSKENAIHLTGESSPNWNPNLSEDKRLRKSDLYLDWRTAIFKRDNYLCQCCKNPNNNRLNAHHIYQFSKYPSVRLEPNNGIALCTNCHDSTVKGSFHNIYGTKNITPELLESYINNRRRILGISESFKLDDVIDINCLREKL